MRNRGGYAGLQLQVWAINYSRYSIKQSCYEYKQSVPATHGYYGTQLNSLAVLNTTQRTGRPLRLIDVLLVATPHTHTRRDAVFLVVLCIAICFVRIVSAKKWYIL